MYNEVVYIFGEDGSLNLQAYKFCFFIFHFVYIKLVREFCSIAVNRNIYKMQFNY